MDTIRFFNLNEGRGNRYSSIPDGIVNLHHVDSSNSTVKQPYYCVSFNVKISNLIAKKQCYYARLAENTLTGELFFVFSKEQTPDSVKIAGDPAKSHNIRVYGRKLVELIMERFGINNKEAYRFPLKISDDKSMTDDNITLLISK